MRKLFSLPHLEAAKNQNSFWVRQLVRQRWENDLFDCSFLCVSFNFAVVASSRLDFKKVTSLGHKTQDNRATQWCVSQCFTTQRLLFDRFMSIPSTSSSLPLNTTWEDVTRDNRASLVRVRSSQWFGDYSKYSTVLLWKVDVNDCSLSLPLERRLSETTKQLLCILACVSLSASVTPNTCSLLFPMTTCSILPNATWEEAIGDNRAVIVLLRSSQCFSDYLLHDVDDCSSSLAHTLKTEHSLCLCACWPDTPHVCHHTHHLPASVF